ncbi:MAG: hypothetical protein LUD46_17240 [Parabacteroides sp.]|nr:hypothetical protein [Parabacteroides sp.]
METDLLTIQESEDFQKLSGNPSPLSKEELKDFYIKMARLIYPSACSSKRSDFEVLNILRGELEKNLGVIGHFTQHKWGDGILEIQMACATYTVQDSIPKKDRLEMNASLGRHLQFLTQMASASSIIRKMQTEYERHIFNLEYLVKQFPKEKKAPTSEKNLS